MAVDDREGRRMTPCRCASHALKYEPATERAPDESMIARFVAEGADAYQTRIETVYRRLSRHECGHVVAAIAFAKSVDYVTIGGGSPHCAYIPKTGEQSLDAFAIGLVAGMVAEDAPPPSWADLFEAIARAREGVTGPCDVCRLSQIVVAALPDLETRETVNRIYDTFEAASDLFQSPQWSGALDALAPALERETLLRGAEIAEIVAPYDLAGPLETIKPIWTKRHEN